MNGSTRIHLRIDRGASDIPASPLLDAAGRALTEAQVNLNHSSLQTPQTLTQEQVVALSNKLASEAWEAGELPGEAPISRLHNEPSGWGDSDPKFELGKIPWLILAADVLDFAALLMGTSDSLVLEVQT